MTTYSRREFSKIALAGVGAFRAFADMIDSKVAGVQLGVQSYSFRDLPLDAAIQAMAADGLGDCELFSPHIEGGHLDRAPMPPGRRPGQMRRNDTARQAAREELRKWRLTVPLDYFRNVREKFNNAGINLYAYNLSFNQSFTDEEIDRGFEMAKALGVGIITASTTLPVAKRVVPFAEKHQMIVAMHGHSNVTDPNQFATPESFAKALAMSELYRVNLDIGHFWAADFDPAGYIREHHEKIVLLHLKDRKKNQGPNMPWGEGDTPIKQVLMLLRDNKYPIPAFIEYEYKGAESSQAEVKKCYGYCKRVLEG